MMCSTCEDFDGELDDGEAIQVGVHHEVGHVAVDEDLAGGEADDFVGGHAAVGAADPEVLGLLQGGEAVEEVRVGLAHAVRPLAVVFEERVQLGHVNGYYRARRGAQKRAI